MNTNRLAKFYPALTAVERLRLIHDSGRRGDAIEQRRLLDAAPRRYYSMADSGRLENNLRTCWLVNNAFQLATAAEFWHAQTQWAWALEVIADSEPIPDEVRFWSCSATITQTVYAIERDGWNLFIRQSGFDESRIIVPPLAEHWLVGYMDEHATIQPDALEAAEWLISRRDELRAKLVEPLTLITPEFIADGWHRSVEELTCV